MQGRREVGRAEEEMRVRQRDTPSCSARFEVHVQGPGWDGRLQRGGFQGLDHPFLDARALLNRDPGLPMRIKKNRNHATECQEVRKPIHSVDTSQT